MSDTPPKYRGHLATARLAAEYLAWDTGVGVMNLSAAQLFVEHQLLNTLVCLVCATSACVSRGSNLRMTRSPY